MNREEQGTRNLELAGRLLERLLDDPARLPAEPGATLLLIPRDDSELAEANLDLAARIADGVDLPSSVSVVSGDRVGLPDLDIAQVRSDAADSSSSREDYGRGTVRRATRSLT
jgi:hypothetical protein